VPEAWPLALPSTLLLSRAGLVTISWWTSMPSLKLLITRFNVWATSLVGRLSEDCGGECGRPGLCPPLHPSSVQSWPLHNPLVDLHAFTKVLITRIDVWAAALVGRLPEDGGGECRRPGLCPPLHPSSVQSWPLHNPFVDLHAITKASYYQVRCVGDSTGGAAP
jgi:hypothetical protein